ncbi:hypothetical protein EJB05_38823, partial [Eragrostis curvula]
MEGQLSWGRQEVDGWRKGPWTTQEDKLLMEHVRQHGEGRWNSVSKLTGTVNLKINHEQNTFSFDSSL